MLHVLGHVLPFPAPSLFAGASATFEVVLPILLIAGFMTRFAAAGLLGMTVIIEFVIPDGWPIHITWAAMAVAILVWGPGAFSADRLIRAWVGPKWLARPAF